MKSSPKFQMFGLIFCLACLSSSFALLDSSYASPQVTNISLGVYLQPLPTPLFYESYIPLIYEYLVPKYTSVDITLRDWREKCRNDQFSPSYTCPTFFHYEKYLERFESEMIPRGRNLSKASLPQGGGGGSSVEFCSRIQTHFPGTLIAQFGLEQYLESLRRCPLGEVVVHRNLPDYTFNIKQIFKQMNKNYESEFSNSFLGAANSKLSPAFYVNAVTTHQNGMLVAYLMERQRWNEAEVACNAHYLPGSLVKVDNLTRSLEHVQTIMSAKNLESPVNLEEVSQFYKLPITDCSYVEKTGSFVVRVQIPVVRKGVTPQLFRMRSIPFIFDDDRGNTLSRQLCQVKPNLETFLFDQKLGILKVNPCPPNDPLCRLDNFGSSDMISPCVSAVFTQNPAAVKKYCEMECLPWKELENGLKILPTFHQIKADTWLVTGHPLAGVLIKCQGKQDRVLEHPEVGSLEVKVPCSCYLAYHLDSYFPGSECEDGREPEVKHILPVHFIKEEKLAEFMAQGTPSVVSPDDYMINGIDNNNINANAAESSAHVGEQSESKSGESHTISGFIWLVFVIQLVCLAVGVAVLSYKYVERRRKLRAFSKERLVYNAYPPANSSATSPTSSSVNDNNIYPQRCNSII